MKHPFKARRRGPLTKAATVAPQRCTIAPQRCTVFQRWYTAFKLRWSKWHRSVFPRATEHVHETTLIHVAYGELVTINALTKLRHAPSECRTKPVDVGRLTHELPGVRVTSFETHGGMGRIYTLQDPTKLLKVADVRRSWCRYETDNYRELERLGLPCAKVWSSHVQTLDGNVYMVTIIERLDFTLSAYIRAAGRLHKPVRHLVALLNTLLKTLEVHDLVYGDLSPDNIMFRNTEGEDYAPVLIDPQFLVPAAEFRKKMTVEKARAFDKTYLALKIQSIGFADPPVHRFADAVCAGILGHTPLEKHARRWLAYEAPIGLFVAYDILHTIKE